MTPHETLYDTVKDLPHGLLAPLYYERGRFRLTDNDYHDDHPISSEQAQIMIEALLTRWLDERGIVIVPPALFSSNPKTAKGFTVCMSCVYSPYPHGDHLCNYPTRLAALIASVRQASKGASSPSPAVHKCSRFECDPVCPQCKDTSSCGDGAWTWAGNHWLHRCRGVNPQYGYDRVDCPLASKGAQ